MHLNPYSWYLFFSAAGAIGVLAYAWRKRTTPGALPLIILMAGAAIWAIGYGVALGYSDRELRIFWAKVQHLGIAVVPLAVMFVALQFIAGRADGRRELKLLWLGIVPAIGLALAWTNEWHGLIWARIQVVQTPIVPTLKIKYGAYFWLYTVYNYGLLVVASLLLVRNLLFASALQRRQTLVLLLATFFPWIGNLLYLAQLGPFPYLDLTPFGYMITGLIMAWGLFRHRLFDVIPMARGKVLEYIGDGVMVLDAHDRLIDLNPAAEPWLERPAAESLGQPVNRVLTNYPQLLAEGLGREEVRIELARTTDAGTRFYEVRSTPLHDRGEALNGHLWLLHDITDRLQVEEALRRAAEASESASRAKSAFLANMSHELRTPLNAILGFSQLLTRDKTLNYQQQSNVETINRSGEHLLQLINDVLDMAKIEAGRLTLQESNFDLYRLMDEVGDMFRLQAERKGVRLLLDRSPAAPRYVQGDARKLRQILINLVGNAVKFTERGEVRLRVQLKELIVPLGAGQLGGCWLRFTVEDTGPGLASDELGQLFQPFVQMDGGMKLQEGTGLGLALSQQLAQLMGGEIGVSSGGRGQGATFTVVVPLRRVTRGDVPLESEALSRRALRLRSGQPVFRLLVIEDHQESRESLVMLLTALGFEVWSASQGEEGVALWRAWQPHLIWLDMRLPVLDGFAVLQQIRGGARGMEPIVIAITASTFEDERARILAAGCNDFVSKPFHEYEIVAQLERHLGARFLYEGDLDEIPARQESFPPASRFTPVWRNDLERAAVEGDVLQIQALAEAIRTEAPALASQLVAWANEFAYGKIVNWLNG